MQSSKQQLTVNENDYSGYKIALNDTKSTKMKQNNSTTTAAANESNIKPTQLPTFSCDEKLPPLPLPDLKEVLDKYLASVRPFVTELEYLKTEQLVRQFESGLGQKLDVHLRNRANKFRNWLEDWWLEWAYLSWRMPIAPFINTSGFVTGKEFDEKVFNELKSMNIDLQLATASFHAFFMNKYFDLLRSEKIAIQQSRSKYFSMDQFRRFYNTCRIPGKECDTLNVHFRTEIEGDCPTHFVIIYKNRFFKVDAYYNKTLLNITELYDQFKKIIQKCKTDGIGIGALTGDHRADWANNRDHLISLHPENQTSLDSIEKSMYALALDDIWTPTLEEAVKYGLYKNPKNRFFDKAYTHIITKNGLGTSNTEHSPYDGIASGTISNYIQAEQKRLELKLSQVASFEQRSELEKLEPTELVFHYDLKIGNEIKKSVEIFEKFASGLDLKILTIPSCDKNTLKSYKINPDTFTQVCMQLGYYQLHNKPAPTYETATTRQFYHGRTETVRSCTSEAIEWCKQMCNRDKSSRLSDTKLLELFKIACKKHDVLMEEARNNRGCDRYLLGIQLIAKELKLDLPEIFNDPSWKKSGGGGNFVISSSCLGYTNVSGSCAPMCTDGYTMIYCFADVGLTFALGRYTESKETDLAKISESLTTAILQVQRLFSSISKI